MLCIPIYGTAVQPQQPHAFVSISPHRLSRQQLGHRRFRLVLIGIPGVSDSLANHPWFAVNPDTLRHHIRNVSWVGLQNALSILRLPTVSSPTLLLVFALLPQQNPHRSHYQLCYPHANHRPPMKQCAPKTPPMRQQFQLPEWQTNDHLSYHSLLPVMSTCHHTGRPDTKGALLSAAAPNSDRLAETNVTG
ncbi:hypothetical protein TGDOM2_401770 [Toxoplasma gondii GAB2-2007-GAL-DOM2]|uniref:Uncharacterized protein n=5 Tax=Toxoplasma gondii TaxID=5811 RepID=A0A086JA73_TOXGO|nr:hypothetical protein TGDOM2_401770 [Toxoplasma gondii GAB2-2007-GAL-DOM2]